MNSPSDATAARVAEILGWTPQLWTPAKGGYTPAARYAVRSKSKSAFVKIATTPLTATMLRKEKVAYEVVSDVFRPRLLGWHDDELPILVLDDLSTAYWPPPWRDERVAQAVAQIDHLHASRAELPTFEEIRGSVETGWQLVARDQAPFLALGTVSASWLNRSLPRLLEAEAACSTQGEAVTHWDIRSDNMCFVDGNVKFIDWSEACLSNPKLDLGFWLPSLCFEGGPLPETFLPDAPEVAAWVSGYFASQAGLPIIPDAPFVRRVQREQLSTALPWAIRALGLSQ
jgi:Phosphotransferase enzyme family